MDPDDIADAIARGSYATLAQVLAEGRPERVIEEVKAARLLGRGGAYFPAAVKWEGARAAPGPVRYLVVNGEEGEPGIFKDRHLMEGDPHRLLEGALLAAYAAGASRVLLYVHGEANLSAARLAHAVDEARRWGMVGARVLGSDFSVEVELRRGAGGFVLGEETALMESIEGRRAMPRAKPPFPVEAGLWGRPTVINNVETLFAVPLIAGRGGQWWSALGGGHGTKCFGLSGEIARPGIVEVELGATLRDLVVSLGGGVPGGEAPTAVVLGGPSGVVVPRHQLDEPLVPGGPVNPGTGGIAVLGGRCVGARRGAGAPRFQHSRIVRQVHALPGGHGAPARRAGRSHPAPPGGVAELAEVVRLASLCGLGQAAPLSLLSALREFPEELGDPPGPCIMTAPDPARRMSATVNVTVDGSAIEVPEGATVLDAVNRLGISLPQLCKDPDRAPLGACRTCLVHVEGQRGLPAACHTRVRAGMAVSTLHPDAMRVRRAVLDLTRSMLVPGNGRDGFGQLGAAGRQHALAGPSHAPLHRAPVDDTKSFFVLDREACILCGRCTVACGDVQQIGAISLVGPRPCHAGGRVRRRAHVVVGLHLVRPVRRHLPHRRPAPEGSAGADRPPGGDDVPVLRRRLRHRPARPRRRPARRDGRRRPRQRLQPGHPLRQGALRHGVRPRRGPDHHAHGQARRRLARGELGRGSRGGGGGAGPAPGTLRSPRVGQGHQRGRLRHPEVRADRDGQQQRRPLYPAVPLALGGGHAGLHGVGGNLELVPGLRGGRAASWWWAPTPRPTIL